PAFVLYLTPPLSPSFFFSHDPATTEIYTLSLHDALPISPLVTRGGFDLAACPLVVAQRPQPADSGWSTLTAAVAEHATGLVFVRSEEHTSELQSRGHLVCRLLLEKKKSRIGLHNYPHSGR